MKCPVCGTPDLLMTERQGVEIDYCPKCRGVWLDRGELDKLISRADSEAGTSEQAMQLVRGGYGGGTHDSRGGHDARDARGYREDSDDHEHRNRHHGYDGRRHHDERPRKKKSLFEMFDFD